MDSMVDQTAIQAKLKILSDAYAAQLPEKLNQLMLAWSALSHKAWDAEGIKMLHHMAHRLAGSGKTFGFSALSDASRQLEQLLQEIEETRQVMSPVQRQQVEVLLLELNRSASRRDTEKAELSPLYAVVYANTVTSGSRQIFIVEDDKELAADMKVKLTYFGYEVSVFHRLSDFRAAIHQHPVVTILMDVNFPEDDRGGLHVMQELQQQRGVPLPVIFMTNYDEMDVRLAAVRAGGVAYLNKPVNFDQLLDRLDELTTTETPSAFRILIVDDSVTLTRYYAAALEEAGLLVRVVNNPLDVLQPLIEFSPDLILIDMYMPECNGMELAKIIRQMERFVSIPIVFLSGERNLDKQLAAIGMGGDDFLTKPIEPQHLISSILSRIKRSMLLRSYMVRDSLTGLFNYSAIKDHLQCEVSRATRKSGSLSFVMLDIDHFQQVNDRFGHAVGDRVIKSFARLLKQRLRVHDLVGRFCGEEFAIILVDTQGPAAAQLLNNIRLDFAQLVHQADQQKFSLTFSCGVVEMSSGCSAQQLVETAGSLLHKAKESGRNQVVMA